MADLAYLWNTDYSPVIDELLDLGSLNYQWKDLYINGIAYIDQVNIEELLEMSDNDIISIGVLYGFDNNISIDMSNLGRMIFSVNGTGTPFATPDYDFTGSSFFDDDMGFDTTKGIYFRDSALFINSVDDGHLDLTADISIDMNADVDISTKNIITDTSTGTKIGTATSQKLGFFNASPIIQPTSTSDIRALLINLGFLASGGANPLDLNGGLIKANGYYVNAVTQTSDYTITANDDIIFVDASTLPSGNIIYITLPSTAIGTKILCVKALVIASAGTVRVQAQSGALIDGNSYVDITADYDKLSFSTDGTNWYTIFALAQHEDEVALRLYTLHTQFLCRNWCGG